MLVDKIEPKVGDLRVWWIPQVPGKAFHVPVSDIEQGVFIMKILAEYDLFQYDNRIKPDYCNTGGIQVYVEDDGEENPGWVDWYDEETGENPEKYLEEKNK